MPELIQTLLLYGPPTAILLGVLIAYISVEMEDKRAARNDKS